jgi:cell division protein FtsQ
MQRKYWFYLLALLIFLVVTMGLAHSHRQQMSVGSVQLKIKSQNALDTLHFLTGKDIKLFLKKEAAINLDSLSLDQLNVGKIEAALRQNQYVKDCQVATDVKGNIWIEIEEYKPLARLINEQRNDVYLSENQTFFPVSPRFTLRTLLLTGAGVEKMQSDSLFFEKKMGKELFNMLKSIQQDAFWRAQITQIHIDSQYELTLYPQIGEQEILFGSPEDYQKKLDKVHLFYKQVIPAKGWGRYKQVSVKYDGQLVCK